MGVWTSEVDVEIRVGKGQSKCVPEISNSAHFRGQIVRLNSENLNGLQYRT